MTIMMMDAGDGPPLPSFLRSLVEILLCTSSHAAAAAATKTNADKRSDRFQGSKGAKSGRRRNGNLRTGIR